MENNEITKTAETTPQTRAAMLNSRIIANAKIAAESLVMVGRDLKAMRDEKLYTELGCDTFEDYCDKMTPIKQRQAYNFIKCYEKYGERLTELSDIGITKLTLMSALDDEDSDALIESGAAESLSVRELEQRVKELQKQNEQLTLDLGEKSKEDNKLEKLQNELERAKAELDAQQSLKDKQAAKIAELEEKNRSMAKYETELKGKITELESKPVEVAVEKPSDEEIEEIRQKAAKEAKAAAAKQYRKDLEELKERETTMRLTAVEAARKESAAEIERLKSENAALQSSAKKPAPNPDDKKQTAKFYTAVCLQNFNSAVEVADSMPEDERAKVINGLKVMVEKMGGLLQ